jgi:hypothetical protein
MVSEQRIAGPVRIAVAVALLLIPGAVQAFTEAAPQMQPAARNREAAILTVLSCNSPGENGRLYYIYQYTNRAPGAPSYRLIIPGDYSRSIGGRDWSDCSLIVELAARGCHSL